MNLPLPEFTATLAWEAAAVSLAVAYLVLAIRQNIWCWAAGIASSAIYLVLLAGAALYMESALQAFYIAMSVYGWRHWRSRAGDRRIGRWGAREHAAALAAIAVATGLNGTLLAAFTGAAMPFLDALIAWGSIVATFMVARKILENWLYWFVLDALSVYVFLGRGLWLTAGLFVLYLVLIVAGFLSWRREARLRPA